MKLASIATFACAFALPATLSASDYDGWRSVFSNGQPVVTGSGRIVTQQRGVSNFVRIELNGFSNLHVRLGAAPSLSIRADDNLMPYLTSSVANGTLKLEARGSFRTRTTPQIYVTVANIDSIRSRGSGNVDVNGVANQRLDLVTQGSGDMRAEGRTGELTVTVQGSGNADVRGLAAAKADVSVMGSGNAWVATRGAVSARAFGSGNVYVLGRPSSLSVREGGSGRVIVRAP